MSRRSTIASVLLALLLAAGAHAQSPAEERQAEIRQREAIASQEGRDRCALLADLARLVMSARQDGVDELRVQSKFAGLGPELIEDVAAEAFEIPRMRESEDRAFIMEQFAAAYELACYRGIGGT